MEMPKIKTHRATAKRFTVTASGKIKRHHAKAAHIKTKKSATLKRNLRKGEMAAAVDVPRIRRLLNV
jgi:large subunit ribosomal protein L35